jgi:NAD(P)-dependent dehydrogenase (short-subunit alcohol dehydrogenase family)
MTSEFAGRRVLVTGASRGSGAGIARAFAKAGAHVILASRNQELLEGVRRDIAAAGGTAEVQVADLSSREGAHDLARRSGDIDVLVNNAAHTDMAYEPVLTRNDAFWDRMYTTGLFSPIALMQALCPGMALRGGGVVINISSSAGQRGICNLAPYSTMKAALDQLSRVAGMEMAAAGMAVRVNCIAFGFVETEGLLENCGTRDKADDIALAQSPLGRLISVEEVGGLCLYLASDIAAPLLGNVFNIDGGMLSGNFSRALAHTE